MKKMNKKGAEMTISTIIVIILALVVLVVLIYGFSTGWGTLWQKITGYGGGKVNVQSVIDSCKLSCTTSGEYDYCNKKRDVIMNTGDKPVPMTCCELANTQNYGLSCSALSCCTAKPITQAPAPPQTGAPQAPAGTK